MRLIYFAPVNWGSYRQRPHFMVEHLLHAGVHDVVWVDPYPTRLPILADIHRRALARPSPRPTPAHHDPRIRLIRPRALPIEPLPGGPAVNRLAMWPATIEALKEASATQPCIIGIGRPSALAWWAIRTLAHRTSFYDAMDDFPAFYRGLSARAMGRVEHQIAASVDSVFCSAPSLLEKFASYRPDARLVPNGYSMQGLPPPRTSGRGGIGYIGTIGRWFDWPLVVEIARCLPQVAIRLTGPQFVPRPQRLPDNIELHPECPQTEAIDRVRAYQIGLIPFRPTELTRSVDPIKYYEYRALGLPVWSTTFGTMTARFDGRSTRRIAAGTDWQALYADTLACPVSECETRSFRAANDWAARFSTVAEQILAPVARPRRRR